MSKTATVQLQEDKVRILLSQAASRYLGQKIVDIHSTKTESLGTEVEILRETIKAIIPEFILTKEPELFLVFMPDSENGYGYMISFQNNCYQARFKSTSQPEHIIGQMLDYFDGTIILKGIIRHNYITSEEEDNNATILVKSEEINKDYFRLEELGFDKVFVKNYNLHKELLLTRTEKLSLIRDLLLEIQPSSIKDLAYIKQWIDKQPVTTIRIGNQTISTNFSDVVAKIPSNNIQGDKTLLHIASEKADVELLTLLLKCGVNVNQQLDIDGMKKTALQLVYEKIRDIELISNQQPSLEQDVINKPLYYEAADLLVDYGANLSVVSKFQKYLMTDKLVIKTTTNIAVNYANLVVQDMAKGLILEQQRIDQLKGRLQKIPSSWWKYWEDEVVNDGIFSKMAQHQAERLLKLRQPQSTTKTEDEASLAQNILPTITQIYEIFCKFLQSQVKITLDGTIAAASNIMAINIHSKPLLHSAVTHIPYVGSLVTSLLENFATTQQLITLKEKASHIINNKQQDKIIADYCFRVTEFCQLELLESLSDSNNSDSIFIKLSQMVQKVKVILHHKRIDEQIKGHWEAIATEYVVKFIAYLRDTQLDCNTANNMGIKAANAVIPMWFSNKASMITEVQIEQTETRNTNATNEKLDLFMAEKLAYIAHLTYVKTCEKITWVIEELYNYNEDAYYIVENESKNLRVLLIQDEQKLIISFRGTANLANWLTDAKITKAKMKIQDKTLYVHSGFKDAIDELWNVQRKCNKQGGRQLTSEGNLTTIIREYLDSHPDSKIYLTGHSLGGALAAVYYLKLIAMGVFIESMDLPSIFRKISLYTYAAPKWCSHQSLEVAGQFFSDNYYRITKVTDIVPRMPQESSGFAHLGSEYNIKLQESILSQTTSGPNFPSVAQVEIVLNTNSSQGLSTILVDSVFNTAKNLPRLLVISGTSWISEVVADRLLKAHSMDLYSRELALYQAVTKESTWHPSNINETMITSQASDEDFIEITTEEEHTKEQSLVEPLITQQINTIDNLNNAKHSVEEINKIIADLFLKEKQESKTAEVTGLKSEMPETKEQKSEPLQVSTDVLKNRDDTALMIAVRKKNIKIIDKLISKKADVNIGNSSGVTALHCAAADGHSDIIVKLIKEKGDINAKNKYKETPLHYATKAGHNDTILLLINNNADVNAINDEGKTPMHYASAKANVEVVEALIDKGAKVNAQDTSGNTPISYAALNEKFGHDIIQLLVNNKAVIRDTALINAIKAGNTEAALCLIKNGANVNAKDELGNTVLIWATWERNVQVVKALLVKSADVNITNEYGDTALLWAEYARHKEIIEILSEKTDKKLAQEQYITNFSKTTALNYVLSLLDIRDQLDLQRDIRSLRESMFSPASYGEGNSALHTAAAFGHKAQVEYLLSQGSDPNIKNKRNISPICFAALFGEKEIVELFLDQGCNPDGEEILSASGRGINASPLHFSVLGVNLEIVELLINRGANPNIHCEWIIPTPLTIAVDRDLLTTSRYFHILLGSMELGQNILMAGYGGNLEIVKVLLKCPSIDISQALDQLVHSRKEIKELLHAKRKGKDISKLIAKDNTTIQLNEFLKKSLWNESIEFLDKLLLSEEAKAVKNCFEILKLLVIVSSDKHSANNQDKFLEVSKALGNVNLAPDDKLAPIISYIQVLLLIKLGEDIESYKLLIMLVTQHGYLLEPHLRLAELHYKAGKLSQAQKELDLIIPQAFKLGYEDKLALEKLREVIDPEVYISTVKEKLLKYSDLREGLIEALQLLLPTSSIDETQVTLALNLPFKLQAQEFNVAYLLLDIEALIPNKYSIVGAKKVSERTTSVKMASKNITSTHQMFAPINLKIKEVEALTKDTLSELSQLLKTLKMHAAESKSSYEGSYKHVLAILHSLDSSKQLKLSFSGVSIYNINTVEHMLKKLDNASQTEVALRENILDTIKVLAQQAAIIQYYQQYIITFCEKYGDNYKNNDPEFRDRSWGLDETKYILKIAQIVEANHPTPRVSSFVPTHDLVEVIVEGESYEDKYLWGYDDAQTSIYKKLSINPPKSEVTFGKHPVILYGNVHYKYYPYAPGIEFVVNSLNKILLDEISMPTRLIKLVGRSMGNYGEVAYYQASPTIIGQNLHDLLTKPSYLKFIDLKAFSALFISSLLTGSGDAKPDNYIARFIKNESGQILNIKLMSIDNDISFCKGRLGFKMLSSGKGKLHSDMLNILFFFPQMDMPVDSEILKLLTETIFKPETIISEWLKELYEQNERYKKLEEIGFTAHDLMELKLPITLPKGSIIEIYNRITKIIELLNSDPLVTHSAILKKFYPAMSLYYEEKRVENFVDSIKSLYMDTVEDEILRRQLADDDKQTSRAAWNTVSTFKMLDKDSFSNKFNCSPEELAEEFIASIDFQKFKRGENTICRILIENLRFIKIWKLHNLNEEQFAIILRDKDQNSEINIELFKNKKIILINPLHNLEKLALFQKAAKASIEISIIKEVITIIEEEPLHQNKLIQFQSYVGGAPSLIPLEPKKAIKVVLELISGPKAHKDIVDIVGAVRQVEQNLSMATVQELELIKQDETLIENFSKILLDRRILSEIATILVRKNILQNFEISTLTNDTLLHYLLNNEYAASYSSLIKVLIEQNKDNLQVVNSHQQNILDIAYNSARITGKYELMTLLINKGGKLTSEVDREIELIGEASLRYGIKATAQELYARKYDHTKTDMYKHTLLENIAKEGNEYLFIQAIASIEQRDNPVSLLDSSLLNKVWELAQIGRNPYILEEISTRLNLTQKMLHDINRVHILALETQSPEDQPIKVISQLYYLVDWPISIKEAIEGVNVNKTNAYGNTLLYELIKLDSSAYWTAGLEKEEAVRNLLNQPDLNPNMTARENLWTPLHLATSSNQPGIVKLLIQLPKTEIFIKDKFNKTPLTIVMANTENKSTEFIGNPYQDDSYREIKEVFRSRVFCSEDLDQFIEIAVQYKEARQSIKGTILKDKLSDSRVALDEFDADSILNIAVQSVQNRALFSQNLSFSTDSQILGHSDDAAT